MMRRLARDSAIYALPLLLARTVGLLLLPIYTRQLGPSDYGFIEFVAAITSLLVLVLPLEVNQAVARMLPESDDRERQKRILASALAFTTVVFAVFGGTILLFRFQLLDVAGIAPAYATFAPLVCFSFLTTAILNLLQVMFRYTGQATSSVAVNISVVMVNLGLVLHFVYSSTLGIEQYLVSQVMSSLVGILIGALLAARRYGALHLSMDLRILRELLSYSMPIVLSSIGVAMSGSVDRLLIGGSVGLAELGYFGAAARIATLVTVGFYVISTAMTPLVYREHHLEETRKLLARTFYLAVYASLTLLVVAIFYAQPIMVLLAGLAFSKSSDFVFYLMLSAVLSNLYIFFLGMDIAKNTRLLSAINLGTGLFGAIGCIIMVPRFGIWGAIVSTLLASCLRLFAYVHFSQKLYPIVVNFRIPMILALGLMVVNLAWTGIF